MLLTGKVWFIQHIHQTLHWMSSAHCIGCPFILVFTKFLNGKNFSFLEDGYRHLEQFFVQEGQKFWEDGIRKLPEKWQKVVEQSSKYIVQ